MDGALERNEVFGFFYCTKPDNRREFNQMQQTFRQAGLMLNDWKAEGEVMMLIGIGDGKAVDPDTVEHNLRVRFYGKRMV